MTDTNSNSTANVKGATVEAMFNEIAPRYDLLNHILSLNIDRIWRKKLIKKLKAENPSHVLDIATGTADLAIMLGKRSKDIRITGIDVAEQMLAVGRRKVFNKGMSDRIQLKRAAAEDIPYPDATFDSAMVAFGVRNFSRPDLGLREIRRVLKPGGKLFVLEFSTPSKFPMKGLYRFYFHSVLPFVGRMVSGHKQAYTYLPESVERFPEGADFVKMMRDAGFEGCSAKKLSFGIATLYGGRHY